jgi:hypothetical protein
MKILDPRPPLYNPRIHRLDRIEPRPFTMFLQILPSLLLHLLKRNDIFIEFEAQKGSPVLGPRCHCFGDDGEFWGNAAGDEAFGGVGEGGESVEEEAGVVEACFEGVDVVEEEDAIAVCFEEACKVRKVLGGSVPLMVSSSMVWGLTFTDLGAVSAAGGRAVAVAFVLRCNWGRGRRKDGAGGRKAKPRKGRARRSMAEVYSRWGNIKGTSFGESSNNLALGGGIGGFGGPRCSGKKERRHRASRGGIGGASSGQVK